MSTILATLIDGAVEAGDVSGICDVAEARIDLAVVAVAATAPIGGALVVGADAADEGATDEKEEEEEEEHE